MGDDLLQGFSCSVMLNLVAFGDFYVNWSTYFFEFNVFPENFSTCVESFWTEVIRLENLLTFLLFFFFLMFKLELVSPIVRINDMFRKFEVMLDNIWARICLRVPEFGFYSSVTISMSFWIQLWFFILYVFIRWFMSFVKEKSTKCCFLFQKQVYTYSHFCFQEQMFCSIHREVF